MAARFALLFAIFSLTVIGQNVPTKVVASPGIAGGVMGTSILVGSFGPGVGPLQPITGHPYSAEQVTEHVQTLVDGTHITQTNQRTVFYRDSQGRTRMEQFFTPPPGMTASAPIPSMIDIADPVAGYRYMLDQRTHTARRLPWQPVSRPIKTLPAPAQNTPPTSPAAANRASVAAPNTRPHPDMVRQQLGTQIIEGVLAEGTRVTTTYPEGFFGNDRPITTVTETWISPDLHVVVLSKSSDPRSGDTTTRLNNISLNEPDPSLFQIPADYTISDPSN